MGMIRVGMKGEDFILILAGEKWPKVMLPLTVDEAADLYVQLGGLLPEEKLNVEPFSADHFEEEKEVRGE